MIGPFRGGRTVAASGIPGNTNVFYAAANNGGVWKTTDAGRVWTPIFDDQPTGSIGALAVAPSRPDTLYVGSGEGLQRPDLSVGDGIYKSTDAGKTWVHLGLRDAQQIAALAVHPRDPERVYAAVLGHPYGPNAERGVFRSTDGGEDVGEGPLQGREHRRLGGDARPVEPGRRLRRAVGRAAGPVGERRMAGARERPLQEHGRRDHVEEAHERPAHVRRGPRAHRRLRLPGGSAAPLRHRGRVARKSRHLRVGRRRGELHARERRGARLGARRRLRRGARASEEPRRGLGREHRRRTARPTAGRRSRP